RYSIEVAGGAEQGKVVLDYKKGASPVLAVWDTDSYTAYPNWPDTSESFKLLEIDPSGTGESDWDIAFSRGDSEFSSKMQVFSEDLGYGVSAATAAAVASGVVRRAFQIVTFDQTENVTGAGMDINELVRLEDLVWDDDLGAYIFDPDKQDGNQLAQMFGRQGFTLESGDRVDLVLEEAPYILEETLTTTMLERKRIEDDWGQTFRFDPPHVLEEEGEWYYEFQYNLTTLKYDIYEYRRSQWDCDHGPDDCAVVPITPTLVGELDIEADLTTDPANPVITVNDSKELILAGRRFSIRVDPVASTTPSVMRKEMKIKEEEGNKTWVFRRQAEKRIQYAFWDPEKEKYMYEDETGTLIELDSGINLTITDPHGLIEKREEKWGDDIRITVPHNPSMSLLARENAAHDGYKFTEIVSGTVYEVLLSDASGVDVTLDGKPYKAFIEKQGEMAELRFEPAFEHDQNINYQVDFEIDSNLQGYFELQGKPKIVENFLSATQRFAWGDDTVIGLPHNSNLQVRARQTGTDSYEIVDPANSSNRFTLATTDPQQGVPVQLDGVSYMARLVDNGTNSLIVLDLPLEATWDTTLNEYKTVLNGVSVTLSNGATFNWNGEEYQVNVTTTGRHVDMTFTRTKFNIWVPIGTDVNFATGTSMATASILSSVINPATGLATVLSLAVEWNASTQQYIYNGNPMLPGQVIQEGGVVMVQDPVTSLPVSYPVTGVYFLKQYVDPETGLPVRAQIQVEWNQTLQEYVYNGNPAYPNQVIEDGAQLIIDDKNYTMSFFQDTVSGMDMLVLTTIVDDVKKQQFTSQHVSNQLLQTYADPLYQQTT
ncbi:MAG: hypothetical protein KDA77_13270, partial [Planctomycetaceae bacterium]|nr:hypothetical protein [Planctomycetaceae bacterium]